MRISPRFRLPDLRRLFLAGSFPGADPRTWATAVRVDQQGGHWDVGVGWVVDVLPYGGELESQDPIPVRVLSAGPGGSGFGEYIPPSDAAEALVVLPGGDPEVNPVLVGYLTNEDDAHPPASVGSLPISSTATTSTDALVSPFDTEIKVSPFHRRQQFAGRWALTADRITLDTTDLRLGGETGLQPALLGQTTVDNTNELLQALEKLAASLIPLVGPLSPLSAIGQTLADALTELSPKINGQLSQVVQLK